MEKKWDYFYINKSLPVADDQDSDDLTGIEFQTKSLEGEYIDFMVDELGQLWRRDYSYTLIEVNEPILKYRLRRHDTDWLPHNITKRIVFYGKPYEYWFTFSLMVSRGKVKECKLISKQ